LALLITIEFTKTMVGGIDKYIRPYVEAEVIWVEG